MKIVSGGQTGVDLAALEFAIQRGLSYGGWVPKGRINEAGRISERYLGLTEAPSAEPDVRTRLNVISSDATLILIDGSESPGTNYTHQVAIEVGKPVLRIALADKNRLETERVRQWVSSIKPSVLNVAGPRESEAPGVYSKAFAFLSDAFSTT